MSFNYQENFRSACGYSCYKTIVLYKAYSGSGDEEFAYNEGDMGSVPRLGRYPGGRHGNLLQYSCLENFMDRGAWQATVHGVTKNQTRLSD